MPSPQPIKKDALLNIITVLLYAAKAFFILAGIALSCGLIAILFRWSFIAPKVMETFPKIGPEWLFSASLFWIALGGAMVVLAYQFVQKLLQVIRTVGEGDPFVADNAARLEKMAWIALALHVVETLFDAVEFWFAKAASERNYGIEIDVESILFILLLFILARVFRKGAEMRSDLEGTV